MPIRAIPVPHEPLVNLSSKLTIDSACVVGNYFGKLSSTPDGRGAATLHLFDLIANPVLRKSDV